MLVDVRVRQVPIGFLLAADRRVERREYVADDEGAEVREQTCEIAVAGQGSFRDVDQRRQAFPSSLRCTSPAANTAISRARAPSAL